MKKSNRTPRAMGGQVHSHLITLTLFVFLSFLVGKQSTHAQIKNLSTLTGLSKEQVEKALIGIDDECNYTDLNKVLFLYNVKTGLLINAGGNWGTQASLRETGLPLWITKDKDDDKDNDGNLYYHFKQNIKWDSNLYWDEGFFMELVTTKTTANDVKDYDNGVYIDRAIYNTSGKISGHESEQPLIKRGWQIEYVANDNLNTFKLYTYENNKGNNTNYPNMVYGENNRFYLVGMEKDSKGNNCSAIKGNSSTDFNGYDEWRLISYNQINDLQQNQNAENLDGSLDLSFLLKCPDFNRKNEDRNLWTIETQEAKSATYRFGLDYDFNQIYQANAASTSKKTSVSYNPTRDGTFVFPDYVDGEEKKNIKGKDDENRYLGKYYCASIKAAHGRIYQDVEVKNPGTYVILCKGYSNTPTAKLFAVACDENGDEIDGTIRKTVLSQIKYMSAQEKEELHIDDKSLNYAGREFYNNHKYFNSVVVQVPTAPAILRLGIEVGMPDEEETETSKLATSTEATDIADEWTVFDDFRLHFNNSLTQQDLILDECRDNLAYLVNTTNTYKNVTLHLMKKFDKDKWNGFILPVSLTRDQFTQAFGANAKLAELTQLTETKVCFTNKRLSDYTPDEEYLKPYVPYIIFPTKDLTLERNPVYTAELTLKDGTTENVSIQANHIDIPNISFDPRNTENGLAKMGIANDITTIDESTAATEYTWCSTYTTETNVNPSDIKMYANGTFARTFCTDAVQDSQKATWTFNNKSFIKGRDNLIDGYFFDQGQMWHSETRPRGLRGFSVWFKTKQSEAGAKKATFYLDGVEQSGTTGIESIRFNEDCTHIERYADGIYHINGQLIKKGTSTQGLPTGLYIVNGKKVIIR